MLNEKDSELINTFHHALVGECNKRNVACRQLGYKEHGDEHYIWMISYFWQIHMQRYELYINVNENNPEFRYGWNIG